MELLFDSLTRAVEGSIWIALGASFIWGILSIILSPCHLSSIPLVIGFISEQGRLTTRRAFGISSLFGLGILLTIACIGLATSAMGRMLGDTGKYSDIGSYAVAGVFFLVGLHLIGIIPMPFSGPGNIGFKRKGLLAAFTLGAVFGIALGPCTFAFMAPVLGVSLQAGAKNVIYGAALLAAYGIGHCSVIVAAGTSTEAVQRYLNWNEKSNGTMILKRICGVLIILGGLYLIRGVICK